MKDILIIYGILLLFCIVAMVATQIKILLLVVAWLIVGLAVSAIFWLIAKMISWFTSLLFRK